MLPADLAPYYDALLAMRSEFDALTLDLGSGCVSAQRLGEAASCGIVITKISTDPRATGNQYAAADDNENSATGMITKIGRGRPTKGEKPMTAYERLKAFRLRKRAAS
jgi:hypothetical protein